MDLIIIEILKLLFIDTKLVGTMVIIEFHILITESDGFMDLIELISYYWLETICEF